MRFNQSVDWLVRFEHSSLIINHSLCVLIVSLLIINSSIFEHSQVNWLVESVELSIIEIDWNRRPIFHELNSFEWDNFKVIVGICWFFVDLIFCPVRVGLFWKVLSLFFGIFCSVYLWLRLVCFGLWVAARWVYFLFHFFFSKSLLTWFRILGISLFVLGWKLWKR